MQAENAMAGSYDTAQICLNGHVINAISKLHSEANQNYCSECGERTITECPNCGIEIRGQFVPDYTFQRAPSYDAPGYCRQCGVRLPWTQRRLDVARMLVEEFEQLTDAERKQLVGTFPDLFVETPRTAAAELTFKRLILKAGKEAADAMRRILLDILSEAVRKSLFGP
jgi:hypothetical protein